MELKVIFLLTFLTIAQCQLIPLSCAQIRAFVDGHNSRRLLLAQGRVPGQPAASKMNIVLWDEELHVKAAKWALSNKNFHNPDKHIPSGRFTTGENLYWYYTTDSKYNLNPDMALESWFGEHANFTYGPLQESDFDNSKNYQIGHYTQMAWSDSIYIGCAISQTRKNRWNNFYVVCNYGPGGNYVNETPYETSADSNGKLYCGTKDCSQPYGPKCENDRYNII
ncbi:venom allergen 5-like [Trichoplusia ni]|uniref:Venom allergen 5-like n=1 Tax=Trichoplusia ni TaxID=7111 RepID=A0A7E5WB02_TRINI|nr:venom allergen 5-like [Trichoplusia ni]XP_026737613.1 venom allergen 5-like [Trichoplusia ni]XP_026737614.1 venom allergen 5-like [Trichoplusia ni]